MRLKFGKSVPGVSGAQASGSSRGAAAADGAATLQYQPSAAASSEYYPANAADHTQNGTAFATAQQQQYSSPPEQQSQQTQQQRVRLKARLSLQQQPSNEPRYTATGRVQRAASRGISRLIAEEGGVPQDHSLPAPPPGTERCADLAVHINLAACHVAGLCLCWSPCYSSCAVSHEPQSNGCNLYLGLYRSGATAVVHIVVIAGLWPYPPSFA